jgi:hypothetical protein
MGGNNPCIACTKPYKIHTSSFAWIVTPTFNANRMWLAQFVCAPQFFKTPSGLCGHFVLCFYSSSERLLWTDRHKASTYTQGNTNKIMAHRHPCLECDSNPGPQHSTSSTTVIVFPHLVKKLNSTVSVRERVIPTEPTFADTGLTRGQRDGSLRPYSRISRQERAAFGTSS